MSTLDESGTYEILDFEATVPVYKGEGKCALSLSVAWPVGDKAALATVAVALPEFVRSIEEDLARRAVAYRQVDAAVAKFAADLEGFGGESA